MRRWLPILAGAALAAVLVVGLLQARGEGGERTPRFDLEASLAKLRGAPEPLAGLHAQAAALLDRGFEERLAQLRGHPVVVNKWASWCGPCRSEFPVFQRLSASLGKEVAFLGLNSLDNRADAAGFLKRFPVPFPSYVDPRGNLAAGNGFGKYFPTTVFFDARGKRAYVHQGEYRSEADLLADIDRYAR
jgi:thiol-disulfide isomerase/thioredoxin